MDKIIDIIKRVFDWLRKNTKNKIVFVIFAVAVVASSLVITTTTGCTSFHVDKASVEGLELNKE